MLYKNRLSIMIFLCLLTSIHSIQSHPWKRYFFCFCLSTDEAMSPSPKKGNSFSLIRKNAVRPIDNMSDDSVNSLSSLDRQKSSTPLDTGSRQHEEDRLKNLKKNQKNLEVMYMNSHD